MTCVYTKDWKNPIKSGTYNATLLYVETHHLQRFWRQHTVDLLAKYQLDDGRILVDEFHTGDIILRQMNDNLLKTEMPVGKDERSRISFTHRFKNLRCVIIVSTEPFGGTWYLTKVEFIFAPDQPIVTSIPIFKRPKQQSQKKKKKKVKPIIVQVG